MNEEQNIPGKAVEAEQDTNKRSLASSLQSEAETGNNKTNDSYYEVDKHKNNVISTIGDGEMRNEGTVGLGDIPDDNPIITQGPADDQDKAELHDSGN